MNIEKLPIWDYVASSSLLLLRNLAEEVKRDIPGVSSPVSQPVGNDVMPLSLAISFFKSGSSKEESKEDGIDSQITFMIIGDKINVSSDVSWETGEILSEMFPLNFHVKDLNNFDVLDHTLSQIRKFLSQQAQIISENLK